MHQSLPYLPLDSFLFPALLCFSGIIHSNLHFPGSLAIAAMEDKMLITSFKRKTPFHREFGSWQHTAVVPWDLPQNWSWGPLLLRQPSQGLSMVGTQDPSMENLCWSKLSQQLSLAQTYDNLESPLPNALLHPLFLRASLLHWIWKLSLLLLFLLSLSFIGKFTSNKSLAFWNPL